MRHVRRTRLDRTRAFVAAQGSRRFEREQRARGELATAPLRPAFSVPAGGKNNSGDEQQKLDVVANDIFKRYLAKCGGVRYLRAKRKTSVSSTRRRIPRVHRSAAVRANSRGNVPVGSIFGVYRVIEGAPLGALQPGREQVAAGYAHYSGATTLVLACGDSGPASSTPCVGEFRSQRDMRCPSRGQIYPERRAFRRLARGIALVHHRRAKRSRESEKSCNGASSAARRRRPPHLHLRWMGGESSSALTRRLRACRSPSSRACGASATDGVNDVLGRRPRLCTNARPSSSVRRMSPSSSARRRPTRRVQDVLRLIDSLIDFVHYVRHSATLYSLLYPPTLLSPPRNARERARRERATTHVSTVIVRRATHRRLAREPTPLDVPIHQSTRTTPSRRPRPSL